MTMKEKMARGIAQAKLEADGAPPQTTLETRAAFELLWSRNAFGLRMEAYLSADAALDALMDPTPEMIEAGEKKTDSYYSNDGDFDAGFKAAIQAAKDGK